VKTKSFLTACLLFLVTGIVFGWKYFLKPRPSSSPSSSIPLGAEKREANSSSFSLSPNLGDPLFEKIIGGVGEGRDGSLFGGEQDFSVEAMVSPGVEGPTSGASLSPGAGTNPIGSFSVPTGPLPSGLAPASNTPGVQVVDVFPINNSAKGEGGDGPGEGGEPRPVNSIPINVEEGDEVTINFHPHSGEDNPGEDHGNKKEETVVVTLDGDQVSVKHSEKFKVSNGNGNENDNDAKENHGNQDNPGHSKKEGSPIEIAVSSDENGVHVHVPKGAHQDFDVDVGVHGKNNDSSTPLDADNSSVTLHSSNR